MEVADEYCVQTLYVCLVAPQLQLGTLCTVYQEVTFSGVHIMRSGVPPQRGCRRSGAQYGDFKLHKMAQKTALLEQGGFILTCLLVLSFNAMDYFTTIFRVTDCPLMPRL